MIVAVYLLCSAYCVSIEARAVGGEVWTFKSCSTHLEKTHVHAAAAGLTMLMGSCIRR
jgi:hypothetical protein